MSKHKAILIDVHKFDVKEVEIEQDNINQMYELLGCRAFDAVRIKGKTDVIYVDDEGLLNGQDRFFALVGRSAVLAGNGLIMGTGDTGESISPNIDMNELEVAFFIKTEDGWLHHVARNSIGRVPDPGFTITEMK